MKLPVYSSLTTNTNYQSIIDFLIVNWFLANLLRFYFITAGGLDNMTFFEVLYQND